MHIIWAKTSWNLTSWLLVFLGIRYTKVLLTLFHKFHSEIIHSCGICSPLYCFLIDLFGQTYSILQQRHNIRDNVNTIEPFLTDTSIIQTPRETNFYSPYVYNIGHLYNTDIDLCPLSICINRHLFTMGRSLGPTETRILSHMVSTTIMLNNSKIRTPLYFRQITDL